MSHFFFFRFCCLDQELFCLLILIFLLYSSFQSIHFTVLLTVAYKSFMSGYNCLLILFDLILLLLL